MHSKVVLIIIAFLLSLSANSANAESVRLSWNPPISNNNSTPLTDLAGYKVYWGDSSGNYSNNMTVLTCVGCPDPIGTETEQACIPLAPGKTYYFVATAFNSNGGESSYSNEVIMDFPAESGTLGNIDKVSPGSATRVDGFDMIYMAKCFGTGITGLSCTESNFTVWKNGCSAADLDNDGDVDGVDFSILSSNFGL